VATRRARKAPRAASPAAKLQPGFPLARAALDATSAIDVNLDPLGETDVIAAVARGAPFPAREIELGHLALSAARSLKFRAGDTSVALGFSADAQAGLGVYDDAGKALAALALGEVPGLDLRFTDTTDSRFVLLYANYQAAGKVTGTHPLGALGSATFGVSGKASGRLGVLHRFDLRRPASEVLAEAVASWCLPRHIDLALKLAPETWVLAEIDGTLAVKLSAQLGYDFTFVRQLKAGGLSGDIGLKLDAAVKASFGFAAAGRYLVVLGRESGQADDARLRLRLYKLARNGINFGLNLKLGVTGIAGIMPRTADDFVAAVLGVHGPQVARALQQLYRWSDPQQDVGTLVAGLVNDKALDLLAEVTGIDVEAKFNHARQRLLDALALWQSLPDRVAAELWRVVLPLQAESLKSLRVSLSRLASSDAATQHQALADILATNGFATTPEAQLLSSLAGDGVLQLFQQLDEVRVVARITLDLLDGGALRRLKSYLDRALSIDQLLAVVSANDFKQLDSLLVGRLAHFLETEIDFKSIDGLRGTIHQVLSLRSTIYDHARKALTSRYGVEFSAAWSRTRAETALLDVEFDTAQPAARALLRAVLADANYDALFTTTSPAVVVRAAVLSHELTRKRDLKLSLPWLDQRRQSVTQSLARIQAEADGGRVVFYLKARQTDTVRNRYRATLDIAWSGVLAAAAPGTNPNLRVHSEGDARWSYRLLQFKSDMGREELEYYTRPFILEYIESENPTVPRQFPASNTLSLWYRQFDDTVEEHLHNGAERFGSVLASYEVAIPGAALGAWFAPRTAAQTRAAARAVSLKIQAGVKRLLPFYYFQDPQHLSSLPAPAALLVWSCLRPTTSARLRGATLVLDQGEDVYWDYAQPELREAMVFAASTVGKLHEQFPAIRLRLEEAGLATAADFAGERAVGFLQTALAPMGCLFLTALCNFESRLVRKAAEALADVQQFMRRAGGSPSEALGRLAEFGVDITEAFNLLPGETPFASQVQQNLGSLLFLEASAALAPALAVRASALLTLSVLKPEVRLTPQQLLDGELPDVAEVAVAQRLVSL